MMLSSGPVWSLVLLMVMVMVMVIGPPPGEAKRTSTRPDELDEEENLMEQSKEIINLIRDLKSNFHLEINALKEENKRVQEKLDEMTLSQDQCIKQGDQLEELVVKLNPGTLFDFAERGILAAVKFYLQEDPTGVNRTNPGFHHCTPIHHACKGGHLATVQFLVEQAGASIESLNSYLSTPLIYAAKYGHPPLIEYLVTKGAQVNYQNHAKNTALYYAVENNQLACVKVLIEKGANKNIKNAVKKSPFDLAKENKKFAPIANYLSSLKD